MGKDKQKEERQWEKGEKNYSMEDDGLSLRKVPALAQCFVSIALVATFHVLLSVVSWC